MHRKHFSLSHDQNLIYSNKTRYNESVVTKHNIFTKHIDEDAYEGDGSVLVSTLKMNKMVQSSYTIIKTSSVQVRNSSTIHSVLFNVTATE